MSSLVFLPVALCWWAKNNNNLTDFQILGCELHKIGSARTCWGSTALPKPLSIIRGGEGRDGEGKGWEYGEVGDGKKGREGIGWDGKGKEGKGKAAEQGDRV